MHASYHHIRKPKSKGPNHTDPPPDLIDGENEYEVEAILAHRKRGRQMQYLVKWRGYDPSNNT